MTSLFFGSELVAVDEAGNVVVPQFLSEGLGDPSASAELLLSKHETEGCLIGYGREHLDELKTRAERRRLADEAAERDARGHYHRQRRTFGLVEKAPRTGTTLRIPPAMRHLGKIGALALFVGAGDNFEIWNPELALESGDEMFRDLAAYRLQSHRGGAAN